MKDIIEVIAKYPKGELFIIELANGFKIEAELDTLYETDNGREADEEGYKEYQASLFVIKKVLSHSEESKMLNLSEGQLYEVSEEEDPISLSHNGSLIWRSLD